MSLHQTASSGHCSSEGGARALLTGFRCGHNRPLRPVLWLCLLVGAGGCSDAREVGGEFQLTVRQFRETATEVNRFTNEIREEYRHNEQRVQRLQDHIESVAQGIRRVILASETIVGFLEEPFDQQALSSETRGPLSKFIENEVRPKLQAFGDTVTLVENVLKTWTFPNVQQELQGTQLSLKAMANTSETVRQELVELRKSTHAVVTALIVLVATIAVGVLSVLITFYSQFASQIKVIRQILSREKRS